MKLRLFVFTSQKLKSFSWILKKTENTRKTLGAKQNLQRGIQLLILGIKSTTVRSFAQTRRKIRSAFLARTAAPAGFSSAPSPNWLSNVFRALFFSKHYFGCTIRTENCHRSTNGTEYERGEKLKKSFPSFSSSQPELKRSANTPTQSEMPTETLAISDGSFFSAVSLTSWKVSVLPCPYHRSLLSVIDKTLKSWWL